MAIASPSNGRNVQPPPGPAEAPARTVASELTDEQRGWLSEASRSDINGWLHVTIKGAPAARGFQYGFLVAEEYAESIRRGYLKDRPQQPWTHIGPDSTGGP